MEIDQDPTEDRGRGEQKCRLRVFLGKGESPLPLGRKGQAGKGGGGNGDISVGGGQLTEMRKISFSSLQRRRLGGKCIKCFKYGQYLLHESHVFWLKQIDVSPHVWIKI